MDIQTSVDNVLRKIGRNMVLFQQLEGLLKHVVSCSRLSGYTSELEHKMVKREELIHKQTLGQLVGQYVEEHIGPNAEKASAEPEELTEPYISINLRTGFNADYYEATKEALAKLVADRNELIHHLLPHFNSHSVESCEQLSEKLDAQAEEIRSEIRTMQAIVKVMREGAEVMASFLLSLEGKDLLG